MQKIFSILVLASVAFCPVQAVRIKPSMKYNKEATQKLQEKLNSIKSDTEVITSDFLKVADQLITQGADPNIYGGRGVPAYDAIQGFIGTEYKAFLSYLVSGSDQIQNPDIALIEKVTKNALDHGANPNADVRSGPGPKHGNDTIFGYATIFGLPIQVRLLIEYGADVSAKDADSGETARTILEGIIKREKEELSDLPQAFMSKQQEDIARMEQIQDILKAAEQKK
jgi:hypothetical protein